MAGIRFHGEIHFNLASHVAAQVHLAEGRAFVGQVEDDCAGQFVMGHASPIGGFEDVDTVPRARALGTGRYP